ncbi:MAG: hypothetical protein KDA24_24695 [Deltaproteobacteria bacterium]|nr:hypothetical protein [Deltaproteobacteria bacterium]
MEVAEIAHLVAEAGPWVTATYLVVRELRQTVVELCSHLRDWTPTVELVHVNGGGNPSAPESEFAGAV